VHRNVVALEDADARLTSEHLQDGPEGHLPRRRETQWFDAAQRIRSGRLRGDAGPGAARPEGTDARHGAPRP
jgi:hypothetical protein